MLAMVLAAAVPALAQSVTQIGEGNVACVQTAVQQNIATQGNGNAQANQNGDNIIANSNVNFQSISQECNIAVEQVTEVVHEDLKVVHKAGKVEVVAADVQYQATATATATASASSAPAAVQYQYAAPSKRKRKRQRQQRRCGASAHGWFFAYSARGRCPARGRRPSGPQDRPLSDRTRLNQAGPFGGPLFRAALPRPAACIRGVLWISS